MVRTTSDDKHLAGLQLRIFGLGSLPLAASEGHIAK